MSEKLCGIGFLLIGLILLSTAATLTFQKTQESSDYYTAAVVEFTPVYKLKNASFTLEENSNTYIKYIQEASQQGADIIVFPEDGVTSLHMSQVSLDAWTTVIPSAQDEYVPCTRNDVEGVSNALKKLSCAAKENRIYVVVNIAEKNGKQYHNTNVVFDRTGKIVARYRKWNLYMEFEFQKTPVPEITTFYTDFGVKFGTFTCFDILFSVPSLNLTRIEGVENIVYTTAWFSEVPFLTAVQTQFGWSFAENVNLLASGYHNPEQGNAGSGIYLGRNGMANVSMTHNPSHRLLISRVPKSSRRQIEKQNFNFAKEQGSKWIRLIHDFLTTFKTVPLGNASNFAETLCDDGFCCDFLVNRSIGVDPSPINYRAAIHNGIRLYGKQVQAGVRFCALIQCSNDSLASCGSVEEVNTNFTYWSIRATFGEDFPQSLTMPTTLTSSVVPFQEFSTEQYTVGKQTNYTIAFTQRVDNIATVGIYSRVFSRDHWKF